MPDTSGTAIGAALGAFGGITLAEMDSVKLLNRIDTKFLTNETSLALVLEDAAKAGYRALLVEGQKISPYHSIYYDTAGLDMYLAHHNRRAVRQKVRTREYMLSGEAWLEIKLKNNKGRTRKKRTRIPAAQMQDFSKDVPACEYLEKYSRYSRQQLKLVLSTDFRRITLVNPAKTERLTIDTALTFTNFRTGKKASLRDAVIIELKQEGHSASTMKSILLQRRVKPVRLSKYCIAETLTDPACKSGRFRVKVRTIEKTINKHLTVI